MSKDRHKVIPTVYLALIKDDQILLSRRYNTGFHDGEYSLPAGHLAGNETLNQTMIREAMEEIGVTLNSEDIRLVHVMHRKEPNEERVNFFFTAERWRGEPENMEPCKCDDLGWFEIDMLPDNVIPYVRKAIDCIRKGKMYSEYGWELRSA